VEHKLGHDEITAIVQNLEKNTSNYFNLVESEFSSFSFLSSCLMCAKVLLSIHKGMAIETTCC
jgi:hypothetical protein